MDMDMGHMHDNDSSLGMDYNYAFARDYWYIFAGVVGLLTAIHGVALYSGKQRLKACATTSKEHATRPDGYVSQAWATTTAVLREIGYPQVYVSKVGFRWTTPPPLGRVLVLLGYWAVIIYFMAWNVLQDDAYYWERIGYRNAWVSIMQLPMIYLLAMKFNLVGFLIGSSHERLNWLHRWVARTMFVTATVHGWHFWTEWVRADFVAYELQMMPLVRYGLGAWGVLLLNVVVGLVPIRRMAYEVWVIQHILSSVVMLVLLSLHIPADAKYLLWMAVSFLVFDRAARWALTWWQNTRWTQVDRSTCQGMRRWGHRMTATAIGDSVTVLTIKDVHFGWHAGQHIYLWIPRLGLLESHPYTIACARQSKEDCCCNSLQLIIRTHKGFSKRLHQYAVRNPTRPLTGFTTGPFGVATNWDAFETLVLLGASTGASFTVPILEHVANMRSRTCVRRVEVVLVAKTWEEVEYYAERAKTAGTRARAGDIDVRLHIAITGTSKGVESLSARASRQSKKDYSSSSSAQEMMLNPDEEKSSLQDRFRPRGSDADAVESRTSLESAELTHEYTSRPDIETLIREAVEQAWGESAVVVCGGREIVTRTRKCVSRLSDERAVHKGTGAQGIYLHVEEYAF